MARTAHNQLVSGSENPHSRSTVNQALGDAVATGVLGNPAIALCAVPLLIPVSALIWAHERPRQRREAILRASTATLGRPMRLPLAFAAPSPERTPSRMSSRCNSA